MIVYCWPWTRNGEVAEPEVSTVGTADELWDLVHQMKEPINDIVRSTGQYILEISAIENNSEDRYLVLTWIDKD